MLESYFDRLFPLNRSLTGNGVRESLKIIQEKIDLLKIHEIPSGTKVFDWEIPNEWNVRSAYIIKPNGEKICDFQKNNLHLLGYSVPIHQKMSFQELEKHLYTLEDQPKAIPYVTSYYKKRWGFCLKHEDFLKLPKTGTYEILIDADLEPGHLTYADAVLEGKAKKEILLSTYICHPSMANNELSGPLMAMSLYEKLKKLPDRKYTYRFVFSPETIGAIAYLKKYGEHFKENLLAGLIITCVGIEGNYTYKRSKKDNSLTNRIVEHLLKHLQNNNHKILDFFPKGSDERQYCSPGFNLPVGSLCRVGYYEYPEYHSSLDNKNLISFESIEETAEMYFKICKAIELNEKYINKNPYCEVQLGKRGLYPDLSTKDQNQKLMDTLLYVLAYADGETDLLAIAEKANICILDFEESINQLLKEKLI